MRKTDEQFDVVVIGGGPSGMMCAGRAAELGARVLILEKNSALGVKLKLTGGGRCNITNADFNTDSFLSNFKEAKKYLYSPYSKFSVSDTFAFFEAHGLPLVIEERDRVFPETQDAYDVFKVLMEYMKKGNVVIKTGVRVKSLKRNDERIICANDDAGEQYSARNFVIATGGLAAPETGATGDGMLFLKKLGHTVGHPNPNLVPLKTNEKWVHDLSGVTSPYAKIRFVQDGKTKVRKMGNILFTHFGVSGPLIINSAYEVKKLLGNGPVEAIIDLFPKREEKVLDADIIKLLETHKDKKMKNVLPDIMPTKIALKILEMPQIKMTERYAKDLVRKERKELVHTLKNLSFQITGTCGMKKAIVADGGVALDEVDLSNMTSRKFNNLYLLGDVLNINRPSGGFSLQLCWTMGFVAGSDIGMQK